MRNVHVSLLVLALSLPAAACCCGRTTGPRPASAARPPPAAPAVPTAETGASDKRIRRALGEKRVKGLEWKDASLEEAVTYLRTVSGVDVWVSPQASGRAGDMSINVSLDDVTVEQVLDVVLTEPWGLTWEVQDGVVRIRTKEELDPRVLRLRYYDVKDLTSYPVIGSARDDGTYEIHNPGRPDGQALVGTLQAEVLPEAWQQEGVTAEARNGILIVRGPQGLHAAVEAWIMKRRAARR